MKFSAVMVATAVVAGSLVAARVASYGTYRTQQQIANRIAVKTREQKVKSLPVPQPVVPPNVTGQWAWIQNFTLIPGDMEVCMNFNGPYEQCASVPWGTWIPLPNKP